MKVHNWVVDNKLILFILMVKRKLTVVNAFVL